jgi:hypothetical protein
MRAFLSIAIAPQSGIFTLFSTFFGAILAYLPPPKANWHRPPSISATVMPEISLSCLPGEELAQISPRFDAKRTGWQRGKGLVSQHHLSYEDFILEVPRRKLRGSGANRSSNRINLRRIHFK